MQGVPPTVLFFRVLRPRRPAGRDKRFRGTYCVNRQGFRVLVRKPQGKRPLERHRHRCENVIEVGLNEIECENVDRIHLAEGRIQRRFFYEHGNESSCFLNGEKFLNSRRTINISRRTLPLELVLHGRFSLMSARVLGAY